MGPSGGRGGLSGFDELQTPFFPNYGTKNRLEVAPLLEQAFSPVMVNDRRPDPDGHFLYRITNIDFRHSLHFDKFMIITSPGLLLYELSAQIDTKSDRDHKLRTTQG